MTTITINRAVLEGTLEALRELLPDEGDSNCGGYDARDVRQWRATADALRAALDQYTPPRNQCGETCERARLCATCASELT